MRVILARPRLDCSFKPGPVPEVAGAPRNPLLHKFGVFIDRIAAYHASRGDEVVELTKPLWQFELEEMRVHSAQSDVVYFPHKSRASFDIGPNALFYKTSALQDYYTVDRRGWGASLSFVPLIGPADQSAWSLFQRMQGNARQNISMFEQPPLGAAPLPAGYLLFVCQLPHDETIALHSDVKVEDALRAVIEYAEATDHQLLVKGHPANRKSMLPLKHQVETSRTAVWVDDASIHTCLSGAKRVFLVNSGVGFEAMLHDKTIIRFGHAEYDGVVPQARSEVSSLGELERFDHDLRSYVGFLGAFLSRCIQFDDRASYGRVVDAALNSST